MRYLIACFVLAAAGVAHADKPAKAWRFLLAGEYHSDEAPAKPGRGWLALTFIEGQWQLVPTEVRAARVHDAVLDAEGEKTGIRISSAHQAIALLRVPGVRAGKVDTPTMRFASNASSISPAQPLDIVFREHPYRIQVIKSGVYLKKGAQRTRLPELAVSNDWNADDAESASLQWAGDLDGDGALDLIVSYSGFNRYGACLFLSSSAASGQLVGLVACHGGVGC